jgi:DNA-binding transcriptional regulator WhiA
MILTTMLSMGSLHNVRHCDYSLRVEAENEREASKIAEAISDMSEAPIEFVSSNFDY